MPMTTESHNASRDAELAQQVLELLAAGVSAGAIQRQTGLPKLIITRVSRLAAAAAALQRVLQGRESVTDAYKSTIG
jgi:hypothetical protein